MADEDYLLSGGGAEVKSKRDKSDKKSKKEKKEKKSKGSKRPRKSSFVDDGAESDVSDDDMDVQMTAADMAEERAAERALAEHDRRQRRLQGKRPDFSKMTIEEEAAAREEMYRGATYAEDQDDFSDEGFEGSSGFAAHTRFQHALLPQSSDPKVFSIRCRRGMGRMLVPRILNKCFQYRQGNNYENKKVDLGIISVFALDHVKEFIYVESHSELFVKEALEGLEGVFRFTISIVNPSDLMQLMERQASGDKPVQKGDYVRLRRAPYKEALGEVIAVAEEGRRIEINVVPKEDFVGKPYSKYVKGSLDPPARFFNPTLAVGAARSPDGLISWGPLAFTQDGYLRMQVSTRMVLRGEKMNRPTADELAFFYKNDRAKVTAAASLMSGNTVAVQFTMGDFVRMNNALEGVVGTIVDISSIENTAKIAVNSPSGIMTIGASLHDLSRFFPDGSHIVVEAAGGHRGESGTVAKSFPDGAMIVISDVTAQHFTVRSNECRLTQMVTATGSAHRTDEWRLFDLVRLNDATVCCIVGIHADYVNVLNMSNEGHRIPKNQLREKLQGKRACFDMYSNPIARNAEVQLIGNVSSALSGTTASVEQVFNDMVFVCSKRLSTNAGLIAVPSKSVTVLGMKTKLAPQTQLRHLRAIEPKVYPEIKRDVGVVQANSDAQSWASEALIEQDLAF